MNRFDQKLLNIFVVKIRFWDARSAGTFKRISASVNIERTGPNDRGGERERERERLWLKHVCLLLFTGPPAVRWDLGNLPVFLSQFRLMRKLSRSLDESR